MARTVRIQSETQIYYVENITIQQRYLFVPTVEFNCEARGALARAASKHEVNVYAVGLVLNQFKMLVGAPNLNLPKFMQSFQAELAKAINNRYERIGQVFEGRYFKADPLDDEALLERFCHIINAPIEAGLVESIRHWPGVNSWKNFHSDKPMQGTWLNRTELRRLKRKTRNKRKRFVLPKDAGIEHHALQLTRLPIFEDMKDAEFRKIVTQSVDEQAERLRRERRDKGLAYLGVEQITQLGWKDGPEEYAEYDRPLSYGPVYLCLQHAKTVGDINREYEEEMAVYLENKALPDFPIYTCRPGLVDCELPDEEKGRKVGGQRMSLLDVRV